MNLHAGSFRKLTLAGVVVGHLLLVALFLRWVEPTGSVSGRSGLSVTEPSAATRAGQTSVIYLSLLPLDADTVPVRSRAPALAPTPKPVETHAVRRHEVMKPAAPGTPSFTITLPDLEAATLATQTPDAAGSARAVPPMPAASRPLNLTVPTSALLADTGLRSRADPRLKTVPLTRWEQLAQGLSPDKTVREVRMADGSLQLRSAQGGCIELTKGVLARIDPFVRAPVFAVDCTHQ